MKELIHNSDMFPEDRNCGLILETVNSARSNLLGPTLRGFSSSNVPKCGPICAKFLLVMQYKAMRYKFYVF